MNRFTTSAAALGFALVSIGRTVALAQAMGPPPGPPPDGTPAAATAGTPSPERMATMRATHAEFERIHRQARAQMLGALTPQHRTQLGTIVGAFATEATPDVAVTAKQIDAILSEREARAILQTETAARASEKSLMEAQRTAFEATLSPDDRARMAAHEQAVKDGRATHPMREPSSDPGLVLLHATLALGGHDGPPGGPR